MALVYPIASLAFLLAAWQAAVVAFDIKPFILPSPQAVFRLILDRYDVLLYHTVITSYETAVGFLLSVIIGIPIAGILVSWRPVERLLYPLLVASQAVPKVAIAPLFIVWLGFGFFSKIIYRLSGRIFSRRHFDGGKAQIHSSRNASSRQGRWFLLLADVSQDFLSAGASRNFCRFEGCHDTRGRG